MATPLIILAGADKGGVGKTQVCRALCDYLRTPAFSAQPSPRILDSQFPKGDLCQFEPTAEVINLTSIQDQMKVFDSLAPVTVVDVAAGLLGYTIRAFDEAMLLEDVRQGALRIALLHVLGPSLSSLSEIADATAMLGTAAKHFIVKNYINETNYFEWDASGTYATSLRALANVTIDVPHLDTIANEAVQQTRCSFVTYAASNASRTLRGRVSKWLERTWRSFDKVGLGEIIGAL
jgi:hypothetical protein